jgi:hypothetical protein
LRQTSLSIGLFSLLDQLDVLKDAGLELIKAVRLVARISQPAPPSTAIVTPNTNREERNADPVNGLARDMD